MNEKGICEKHGEFILAEGCPQCLAERRKAGIRPEQDEMEDGLNQEGSTLAGDPLLLPAEPTPTAIVRVKPEQDIEVRSFYDQAVSLLDYADQRVITTVDDLKPATDDLSIIAKVKKALEEKRKGYLNPLQEHIKEINETFKALLGPIEQADKVTRHKILAFQQEQERIRREQEEVNRLRMEAAQKEMALKGELTEPVDLVEVAPEAPKRVSTGMGAIGQRDNWKWEVMDFALVPDEYKVINAGVLTPIVKASKGKITIPGIRIYNEPIIAVNAR